MEKIVTYQAKLSDRAIHRKDVRHLLHTRKPGHWHRVDNPALRLQLHTAFGVGAGHPHIAFGVGDVNTIANTNTDSHATAVDVCTHHGEGAGESLLSGRPRLRLRPGLGEL